MDIRNTRQLKDFSAGRLANAREGQKIILYFSLITIAVSAVATVVSYILSQQIAKTGGLGSMGVRSALTTAQMLLPIVQAFFLMCLELGYLSTMLRIARGQYASPNGMRLGFDRFWALYAAEGADLRRRGHGKPVRRQHDLHDDAPFQFGGGHSDAPCQKRRHLRHPAG